jgi:hypothetical protein
MRMLFGSDQQPVDIVVDTGSAALHTCGFDPGASDTAVDSNKQGILSYGGARGGAGRVPRLPCCQVMGCALEYWWGRRRS